MGDKTGVWGRKSPSGVQGQSAGGVWGPQKPETNANFQLRRVDMHTCPPGYATEDIASLVASDCQFLWRDLKYGIKYCKRCNYCSNENRGCLKTHFAVNPEI